MLDEDNEGESTQALCLMVGRSAICLCSTTARSAAAARFGRCSKLCTSTQQHTFGTVCVPCVCPTHHQVLHHHSSRWYYSSTPGVALPAMPATPCLCWLYRVQLKSCAYPGTRGVACLNPPSSLLSSSPSRCLSVLHVCGVVLCFRSIFEVENVGMTRGCVVALAHLKECARLLSKAKAVVSTVAVSRVYTDSPMMDRISRCKQAASLGAKEISIMATPANCCCARWQEMYAFVRVPTSPHTE